MLAINKKRAIIRQLFLAYLLTSHFYLVSAYAFEKAITVPAENPQGITVDLERGEYTVKIEGGAVSLFYPINPNYRWFVSISVGSDVEGGEDRPNIGKLYFEPVPTVYTQAEADRQAVKAAQEGLNGTYLRFTLKEPTKVRFWVNDFDYTDNSGMIKLKIYKN